MLTQDRVLLALVKVALAHVAVGVTLTLFAFLLGCASSVPSAWNRPEYRREYEAQRDARRCRCAPGVESRCERWHR